jgi:hypothetical protein
MDETGKLVVSSSLLLWSPAFKACGEDARINFSSHLHQKKGSHFDLTSFILFFVPKVGTKYVLIISKLVYTR